MKTAYELAMERLAKAAPATKLTGTQKKQLAELNARYAAKIAGGKSRCGMKSKSSPPLVMPRRWKPCNSNWSRNENQSRRNWREKRNKFARRLENKHEDGQQFVLN